MNGLSVCPAPKTAPLAVHVARPNRRLTGVDADAEEIPVEHDGDRLVLVGIVAFVPKRD